jgi:hypothetical protein
VRRCRAVVALDQRESVVCVWALRDLPSSLGEAGGLDTAHYYAPSLNFRSAPAVPGARGI